MLPPDDRFLANPGTLVALLCTGQIVAWTLAPSLTHIAPPIDVVEGYMWGREWVIGTYKHPALPSWLLQASFVLTGTYGWPAYLLSQLCIAATFAFVYLLGRDLMDAPRAAAGTLLLTGVYFFSWQTLEFNHNVAQMPLWAGFAWTLWRAVERRAALWWMLAGAFAAAGCQVKLSTGLLLLVASAWILFDPRARQCLKTPGPWLGLAVFAVGVAPLTTWLLANDFPPIRYVASRMAYRQSVGIKSFTVSSLAAILGMVVILVAAGLLRPQPASAAEPGRPPIEPRAMRFLLVMVGGPLVITVLAALIAHTGLRAAWANSMFNQAGLLAVALTSRRFSANALRRTAMFAFTLLVVLPLAYAFAVSNGSRWARGPMRVQWPQAEIAERMSAIWTRETGAPLKIVAGENWIAGLVGLKHKDKPSLLSNADIAYSPWISPDRLASEGMLVIWESRKIPNELRPYLNHVKVPIREERFKWAPTARARELVLGYLIVPPKQALAPAQR